MTTVIVICAGEATRWGDYTGSPKHLLAPEGERLIDRTARLAREHGADQVFIVAKPGDRRYESPYADLVDARLNPDFGDADKFLSSRHLWSQSGRTVVVYGDCWIDDDAMATILDGRDDWTLYCRPGPSAVTGATSGECFAVGFWPQHHGEYEAALRYVAGLWRAGVLKRCGGWETYRRMCGVTGGELRRHRMYGRHVEIGGWTEDFDKPADWDKWISRRRSMFGPPPSVSVVVPWRADGGHRDRAWTWVQARWTELHPTWQIVVGEPPDGPWCKAAAVADALTKADGSILVVADADVWCDATRAAVEAVHRSVQWAIPHGKVYRLTEDATNGVLAGEARPAPAAGLDRTPYVGVEGGGLVVLHRDTYRQTPLDRRFVGWGQEDESWGLALRTVVGPPWRGVAPLWHLWHPPQPRLNQHVGSQPGRALHVRYQCAARDGVDAMRALLAETAPASVT